MGQSHVDQRLLELSKARITQGQKLHSDCTLGIFSIAGQMHIEAEHAIGITINTSTTVRVVSRHRHVRGSLFSTKLPLL